MLHVRDYNCKNVLVTGLALLRKTPLEFVGNTLFIEKTLVEVLVNGYIT